MLLYNGVQPVLQLASSGPPLWLRLEAVLDDCLQLLPWNTCLLQPCRKHHLQGSSSRSADQITTQTVLTASAGKPSMVDLVSQGEHNVSEMPK